MFWGPLCSTKRRNLWQAADFFEGQKSKSQKRHWLQQAPVELVTKKDYERIPWYIVLYISVYNMQLGNIGKKHSLPYQSNSNVLFIQQ